jgi:DNA-binding SARP family transcriptional activator/predicted ATPase/Tfp pilus assembly protein PilF
VTASLQITLLGSPRVAVDGAPVTGFVSSKAAALLYYLAATGRPHTRETLATLLWPEVADEPAKKNLRDVLSNLRRLLEPYLEITRQSVGWRINAAPDVDSRIFVAKVENAIRQSTTTTEQTALLRTAVALYQGEFLQGFHINATEPFEEWQLAEREHLRQLAQQAFAALIEAASGRAAYTEGIDYATRLLVLEPWAEETHRRLMTLLVANGQRAAALAQFERCREMLVRELGVEPAPETVALHERIRAADPARHNLPAEVQLTPFVGRTQELAEINQLLHGSTPSGPVRLLTLVGLGGVGKTRLALQVALANLNRFLHGVYFVPLAALTAGDGLVSALASALGFAFPGREAPATQLLNYLRDRELLLVLDNFEHLLTPSTLLPTAGAPAPEVTLLGEILRVAPQVKLLVTSRARLNLRGEWLFAVEGLPAPPYLDSANAEHFDAVQLFLHSARRTWLHFAPDGYDLQAIVRICQLVDGLPLGVELAAAWVQLLPCREIAAEIERSLAFLESPLVDATPRQRSLRAVFDYSWALLAPAEQQALTRMTVFQGAFDRTAAQSVAGLTLAQILALTNKSLVQTVAPGRYALHALVQQFATEKSTSLADEDFATLRERHSAYYLRLVTDATATLFGREPQQAMTQLLPELDNLRGAWRWGVAHARIRELADSLRGWARFYDLAGLQHEAVVLLQHALDQPGLAATDERLAAQFRTQVQIAQVRALTTAGQLDQAAQVAQTACALADILADRALQAAARHQLGVILYRQGESAQAQPHLEQALTLARQHALTATEADTLMTLGDLWVNGGDRRGRTTLEQALALFIALGDSHGEAHARNSLGVAAYVQGDYGTGKNHFEQALHIHRALGDRRSEGMALNNLANIYSAQRTYGEAERYLHGALQLAQQTGYRIGEVLALLNLGVNHQSQAQRTRARLLFEQALTLAQQISFTRGEGTLLNNLGTLALDEGDYARAHRLFDAALTVARQTGDRHFEAARLNALGDVARAQGDYWAARAWYAQALALTQQIQARHLESKARTNLGLVDECFGNGGAAETQLTQALILARATDDGANEERLLALLGRFAVYYRQEEEGLALIEQALTLARTQQSQASEAVVLSQQATALAALGRTAEAITTATTSLELWRSLDLRGPPLALLALLAELQLAEGKAQTARIYVEEILQLVGEQPVGGVDDPWAVYRACYRVLAAVGDERAEQIRTAANHHLHAQAAQLTDQTQAARWLTEMTRMFKMKD